jgi:uncharacterized protein (DUF488 family)
MKALNVLTIGYEGAALEDFLSTLKRARVSLLLDVREIALSRRKGFSKSALSAALSSFGIDYRHERALAGEVLAEIAEIALEVAIGAQQMANHLR